MRLPERQSRETGRDYALRTIKENIITLELAPGSQISENVLATEMGLSRTPVREALIDLAKVKIIEIYPQKKSIVSLIDCELVEEARFMRNLLECAVAELDCQMAKLEDLERLRQNVLLQKFYLDSFYPENVRNLDNQFHGILFDIARKPEIFTLMQNIIIHFERVRSIALSSVKNQKIVEDHENIMDAIANRDALRARALMLEHLDRYEMDTVAIREKYPHFFKK